MNLALTDEELAVLIRSDESDRIERKESLSGDAKDKIKEAICAFANDLPNHGRPGVIVVGMTDKKQPTGLPIDDQLLLTLGAMREDGHILPIPTILVEKRSVDGHEYGIVVVAPSDTPPVRYRGRIWIRVGPRRALASGQDERILNERRRHRDLPFDLHPIAFAKLTDLDRRRFEDVYLPSAFAANVLQANERTYEERLAALKMIASVDDPTPTVVGLLTLSNRPRDFIPAAYIQFLRVDGRELGDPIIDSATIDGPLAELVREADLRVRVNIQVAVDIVSEPLEKRTPTYPRAAVEQVIRNAVMHRSYEGTNAPIRVHWFKDRIEVLSPGGPFGAVTPENFGSPGVTDYRNPTIADAMRTLDIVQRFGIGLSTAKRTLSENGNPPLAWDVNDQFVLVKLGART